jgi:hypothetical protein
MKCVACECDLRPILRSMAFLGGMVFTAQHNNDAIAERLCEEHKAELLRLANGTADAVRPEARR